MLALAGYDMHATFLPAEQTGGDTCGLSPIQQGLLVLLGDATGHGIAPALSVTPMQAMLRMAFQPGADLETAFREVIGLLDAAVHRLRFLSAGQAPVLSFWPSIAGATRQRWRIVGSTPRRPSPKARRRTTTSRWCCSGARHLRDAAADLRTPAGRSLATRAERAGLERSIGLTGLLALRQFYML